MRLAFLSDIHGNLIALDAVLVDIRARGGVDAYWVLGDVAAIGYAPVPVIERLVALPSVRFVRGNTDRHVAMGLPLLPSLTPEEMEGDPHRLVTMLEIVASFAWTQGAVAATGYLDWLTNLPLEQRLTLPDGTRLLGVHAAPGHDDGPGIHPGMTAEERDAAVAGSDADLVCVGHTHLPMDQSGDGVRVINLGSVSNPKTADRRASYGLLEADARGYQFHPRRVAYEYQAVIAAITQSRHPAMSYLLAMFSTRTPDGMATASA